jgi:hypothetical protein
MILSFWVFIYHFLIGKVVNNYHSSGKMDYL